MTGDGLTAAAKFGIVGIANTVVGLVVVYLLKWMLGAGDVLANASGYLIGLAISFILNRQWTFRHGGAIASALLRFLSVFLVAYLVNLGTVLLAIDYFSLDSYIAQAIGIVPYALVFFLGSRYFAFWSLADHAR